MTDDTKQDGAPEGQSSSKAMLGRLIVEARGLAGDNACASGHFWQSEGGRRCPRFESQANCSQTVYVCARCGQYDFGETGGPAHIECFQECQEAWRFDEKPWRSNGCDNEADRDLNEALNTGDGTYKP